MYVGNVNSYAINTMYSALGSVGQTNSSKLLSSYLKGLAQYSSHSIDQGTLAYVTGIKTGADDLLAAAKGLTGSKLFHTLASSDSKAMTVEAKPGASLDETQVEILQVAKGQVNQGAALQTKGKSFATGTQQFEITMDDGTAHRFSVNVKAGDTNDAIQQKMADAVNARGIGITATLEQNNPKGTATLKLEGAGTGTVGSNAFTVKDVGSGSLIARSEVSNITTAAQDAKYRINGGPLQTAKSNDITLAKGVTATLKEATDSVSVTTGVNPQHIMGKFQSVLDSFNGLLKQTDGNDAAGARRLANNLTSLYSTYSTSLNEIGISMGSDGYLHIDEEKMTAAAQNGSLDRFISSTEGKNFGFTSQLERVANQVKTNTVQFTAAANPYNSTYNDWLKTKSANHTEVLGLLLNFTI